MSKKQADQALIERSPGEVVRDFLNLGKVKRMVRLGSDVFSAATSYIEKPTPLNAARAVFMVGKIIVDDLEVWPEDYFDDSWESPWPEDFTRIILKALKGKPVQVIKTSDEAMLIHVHHFKGLKFGYVANKRHEYVPEVFVQVDALEEAKVVIKEELWRLMKNDNIVLRQVKVKSATAEAFNSISLEVDDAFRPMPSKRAGEYSLYLRKCIDAGVSRSVMLYGPPGTGKSTMARTIVESLGMKSFRIRVEDIAHIETSAVFEAISIFEPDAVILDDFDRSDMQAKLLETLEFFQQHVKLVIATVNNKNNLDEAILRPGRFDELLQIKQMDDDVVRAVLGEEHAFAYDTVKDWPIAFIQEYVKRLRFMNPEEAASSVKELAQRVKRLKKYDDEEESPIDRLDDDPPRPPPIHAFPRDEGGLTYVSGDGFADAIKKAVRKKGRGGKKSLKNILLKG
jgi:hypothetical protein